MPTTVGGPAGSCPGRRVIRGSARERAAEPGNADRQESGANRGRGDSRRARPGLAREVQSAQTKRMTVLHNSPLRPVPCSRSVACRSTATIPVRPPATGTNRMVRLLRAIVAPSAVSAGGSMSRSAAQVAAGSDGRGEVGQVPGGQQRIVQVGDVQGDDLDREFFELAGDIARAADARVDLARRAGGKFGHEAQADAAVRARDERHRSGGLARTRHGYLRNIDAVTAGPWAARRRPGSATRAAPGRRPSSAGRAGTPRRRWCG
jgi:hypothetical protein